MDWEVFKLLRHYKVLVLGVGKRENDKVYKSLKDRL